MSEREEPLADGPWRIHAWDTGGNTCAVLTNDAGQFIHTSNEGAKQVLREQEKA